MPPSSCTYSSTYSSSTTSSFLVGVAIQPILLICTGGTAITSCALTSGESLPGGLLLSLETCTITGTPTEASVWKTYTVMPKNDVEMTSGLSVSLSFSVSVPSAPFGCSYLHPSATYYVNAPIATNVMTCSFGSAITSCSSSPPLPSGLTLSQGCYISGTPHASLTSSMTFMVMPFNIAGSSPAPVSVIISILPPGKSNL